MKYADFGSISSGTMRTADLLSAFASELDYQLGRQSTRFPRRAYRKLINEARGWLHDSPDTLDENEHCGDLVNELMDVLNEFSPPYAYFGSHSGDGADYGYWLSENLLTEDFDGLKVDDLSEVPSDYRGEVLHVNGHGNVSLYVAGSRGKLREIWAVV